MPRGLVIGKFIPPTMGHKYLIDFACEWCGNGNVDVVVGYKDEDVIPGIPRAIALGRHYANRATVYLTKDEYPAKPVPGKELTYWKDIAENILQTSKKKTYDYVFASEEYGFLLAHFLGAKFIPVDIGRRSVMVSATIVRESIMENWDYVLPEFRQLFCRKVVISGAESTGKTTLARDLAIHFKTEWVPEWACGYLELHRRNEPQNNEYWMIAKAQAAAEDALIQQATKVLICDSDAVVTKMYARKMNNFEDDRVNEMAKDRHYDLRIVLDTDVPFVQDGTRGLHGRHFTTEEIVNEYNKLGHSVIILDGDFQTRFQNAVLAIRKLLVSEKDWKGY